MREFLYISWLNNLGGFEYWLFTGYKDRNLDVQETGTTETNVFPNWPKSYGKFADTITKQTHRKTKKTRTIRSQPLTREQAEQMGEEIKSSPVVQIIDSRRERRTVIVDDQSFTVVKERDKLHALNFIITYTDTYATQHV